MPDIAQPVILLAKQASTNFLPNQSQCGPCFLQMLPRFVNRSVVDLSSAFCDFDCLDKFGSGNPANALRQGFVIFQFVSHACYSRASLTLLYRFSPVISRPNHGGALNFRR